MGWIRPHPLIPLEGSGSASFGGTRDLSLERRSSLSLQSRFYPETRFGGFTDIDGTVVFYSRIQALLSPDMILADFGCGRGAHNDDPVFFRRELRIMQGKVKRVIGLDVDSSGADNPFVDEFRQLTPGSAWPMDDASVDLIFADHVMEHLPDPSSFFRESARVVRPGGFICIRTPNKLGYVGLISRIVPNRFHAKFLRRAQTGRAEADIFPTLYRCNTARALRRKLQDAGFDAVVYGYEAEPSYLGFSTIAYSFGVWHQRYAPRAMKLALFAFGRRRG